MNLGSWKTSAAGIAAIAGTLALTGRVVAEKRWPTADEWTIMLTGLATGLGLIVARDNNKSSEQVGAKPANPPPDLVAHGEGEKTIYRKNPATMICLLACAVGLAASQVGCTTTSAPPTPEQDTNTLTRLRIVATIAARTGATVDLRQNPDHRPYYVAANQALAALILAEDYDPVKFQAALANLPIKELRSENATLIVDAAVILYELSLAEATPADRAPRVKAFATGVHDGLSQALKTTKEE